MYKSLISEKFPHISDEKISFLNNLVREVLSLIMSEVAKLSAEKMPKVHINLREELIHESAQLYLYLAPIVLKSILYGRDPKEIDLINEREICNSDEGIEKAKKTADLIFENVFMKKYKERWEPKTRKALENEKAPKKITLKTKKVVDNHYIPKFFIKKFSSKSGMIRIYSTESSVLSYSECSFGKWGFLKNIYSDRLEAFFGLIESKVAEPIRKIIAIEPINTPQKRDLVYFVIFQSLRNPIFINNHKKILEPILNNLYGAQKLIDLKLQRDTYEYIFSDEELLNVLSNSLMDNQFLILTSENFKVVLPDVSVLHISANLGTVTIFPIMPNKCLMILPIKADRYPFPWYLDINSKIENDLHNLIISKCHSEFVAIPDTNVSFVNNSVCIDEFIDDVINSVKDYHHIARRT